MNDTKTDRLCVSGDDSGDAQLRREVSALLASKGGIDEHKAKHLRKRWGARQSKDEGADESAADDSLAALFVRLRERVHEQVELRERQFTEVEEKLVQLRACLENGDVKQSQQLEQSVIDGLNRITGLSNPRRQRIITGLETLRPKLHKLTAWRKWGTVQAREKMIEEIKGIHQSGATLAEIARRIQQARREWQQWDAAGEGGDKKLYGMFDRACVKAYQPCQAHFDRQKAQRKQNSDAREQICALLEREFEGIEWRDLQWKKTQQLVQTQMREWRSSGPADFKLRKPLQQRFDAIVGKFDERLGRERQRNCKIREKLIADVEQLAEGEDTSAALAELRNLKKQWVPTVTSSRAKEQALWKRFTQACDKVHAKRERERKDFARTLEQNLKAKEALCAEIEGNCRSADAKSAANSEAIRAGLGRWQAQWTQLGEVPKAAGKKINTRYRNAIADAQKALAKAGVDEARRLQDLLRQKSLVCADIEASALAAATDNKRAAQPKNPLKDLTERWDALAPLPDELERAISERYQLACAAVVEADALQRLTDAMPANLETLHKLLLQLEILAEVDSPAEFSKQRMALRIGRLSAALGKPGDAANPANPESTSAEQLIRGVLLLGAVDGAQHGLAFERLDRCLEKLRTPN